MNWVRLEAVTKRRHDGLIGRPGKKPIKRINAKGNNLVAQAASIVEAAFAKRDLVVA